MVIKPVEIFCVLFGVHWISSPTQKLFFFCCFSRDWGRYKRQNIVISLFTTSGQQPQVNDVNWKQILALTLIVERER